MFLQPILKEYREKFFTKRHILLLKYGLYSFREIYYYEKLKDCYQEAGLSDKKSYEFFRYLRLSQQFSPKFGDLVRKNNYHAEEQYNFATRSVFWPKYFSGDKREVGLLEGYRFAGNDEFKFSLFSKYIQLNPQEIFLDIGSGAGRHSLLAAAHFPKSKIIATEVNIENLELFLYRLEQLKPLKNLALWPREVTMLKPLPLADNSVIAALTCGTFYMQSPEQFKNSLLEIFRVLKNAGTLIWTGINLPNSIERLLSADKNLSFQIVYDTEMVKIFKTIK